MKEEKENERITEIKEIFRKSKESKIMDERGYIDRLACNRKLVEDIYNDFDECL